MILREPQGSSEHTLRNAGDGQWSPNWRHLQGGVIIPRVNSTLCFARNGTKDPYHNSQGSSQPAMHVQLAGASDPGSAWLQRPLGALGGSFAPSPVECRPLLAREEKGRPRIWPTGWSWEPSGVGGAK